MATYPSVPTPTPTPEDRITPNVGHEKYIDWMEDDTQRDPTPSNKRRAEQVRATRPKPGTGVKASHGKINTKGATSAAYKAGLPEGV